MAHNFVLVHGGWQSGWCWEAVVDALRGAGHRATTADWLPDTDAPAEDAAAATVDRAGERVAEQIAALGWDEVIMVGHSGGGPVIQRAADVTGSQVARLIFVDAWVLRPGETVGDVVPGSARFKAEAEARADRSVVMPPQWWEHNLMNGADPQLIASTAQRLVPLPFAHFERPLSLSAAQASHPASYVLLDDDISVDPAIYRAIAGRLPGARIVHCAGPHEAMLTHPHELATALASAVADDGDPSAERAIQ